MPADEEDVVALVDEQRADDLVAVLLFLTAELDRDDAALAVGVVLGQAGLLDQSAAGGEHQVGRDAVVADVEDLRDLLVGLERQQVRDVLALGIAAGLGNLVGLRRGRRGPSW